MNALTEALPSSEFDLARRFGGIERLFGHPHAHRIRKAHVTVVGIGGVGSWSVEALARSGVGHLTLIDLDHVSESNINRQLHALTSTLGQAKVLAMQERIALIHPECVVSTIDEFITPENAPHLLPPQTDVLIDATDQVRAKVAMAAWALTHHKPMITVGAAGGKRHAHQVQQADLGLTTHDPLLAQMRQQLRKAGLAPPHPAPMGIHAVFSKEPITQPQAVHGEDALHCDPDLNCHGYGSLVTVTATFGHCAAGWALNQLSA